MPERKNDLVPIKGMQTIEFECDVCCQGYMKPTGIMLTSLPPKYQHECNVCKAIQNFDCSYPRTVLITENKL